MTKVPLAVSFQLASVSGNRDAKRSEIERFFELDEAVDIWLLTETWLRCQGDDAKCVDVTPPGYTLRSFPPPTHATWGGGASLLRNNIMDSAVITSGFSFKHTSFELAFNSLSHCSSACPPPTEIELFILLFVDDFTCLHCNRASESIECSL